MKTQLTLFGPVKPNAPLLVQKSNRAHPYCGYCRGVILVVWWRCGDDVGSEIVAWWQRGWCRCRGGVVEVIITTTEPRWGSRSGRSEVDLHLLYFLVAAAGGDGGRMLAGDDGGGGGNSPKKERECVL
ncbi:transposase, MuDR [Tanacetum coccineum]